MCNSKNLSNQKVLVAIIIINRVKKRFMPDHYFIIVLALEIISHFIFPVVRIIFFPYSLVGIILLISGILVTFWTNYTLLKKNTTLKPYEIPSYFITSGPFRCSRNPLYLGMTIALFGVSVFLGSLSPFIFPIFFIIIIEKFFVVVEEENLEKKFGSKYNDYKKRVRRWL